MRNFKGSFLLWLVPFLLVVGSSFSAQADFLALGTPRLEAAPDPKAAANCANFPSFEKLSKELSPSVVNIAVEAEAENAGEEESIPGFPFFKNIPGQPLRSLGSGFIASPDGYVITNNHVIANAKRIVVRLLDDKTEYLAKLIGSDDKTDLSLLKIEPKSSLKAVFAGDSDKVEVGEWVLAIGNQFQLGQTVTAGIVSAKSRRVSSRISGPYDDFIQTDASINPGSSGGPLFNRQGQVIGINTAIFSPGRNQFGGTGFNIGIGFAIPMNLARIVLTQLKERGRVTRGLLGVMIENVDADMAEALALKEAQGALVADIVEGSPAQKAGFQLKDVIIEFNGLMIHEHSDLPLMVANTPIGKEVVVKVLRNDKEVILHPIISEMKGDPQVKAKEVNKQKPNKIGLVLQNLDKVNKELLEFSANKGVLVLKVDPESISYQAGLMKGDVIEELNNQPVNSTAKFEEVLAGLSGTKAQLILVKRKEGRRFLTLRLKPASDS